MASVACAVFLLDSAALGLPGSPHPSAPPRSDVGPRLLWLPVGVTNLLPFSLCHPELVVAQQEGPHSLADLGLDASVVDEAQQLLLLVALRWGGRRAKGAVDREPGQTQRPGSSASQTWFSEILP